MGRPRKVVKEKMIKPIEKIVTEEIEREIITADSEFVFEAVFSDEDIVILDRLQKLTAANPQDKLMIAKMYNKYVDPSVHVCSNCDEPIRLAFKKLMKFYTDNK